MYNQYSDRNYDNFLYQDNIVFDNRFNYNNLMSNNDFQPFVFNIDEYTRFNNNFRTTIWTGRYLQVTLMSIPVKETIGLEIHPNNDQFLKVVSGDAIVQMGKNRNNLTYQRRVKEGYAVIVPSNTYHNIINVGNRPLKLYSIYAPIKHKPKTIHKTKKEALEEDREDS